MALNYDPTKSVYPETQSFSLPELQDNSNVKDTESYIDPEKATVEGRVNSLMNNSYLKQSAQKDAMQTGASRGLINSNMTATAGTDSLLRKATDIATPDAQTYAQFGLNAQEGDMSRNKSIDQAQLTGAINEQSAGNTMRVMDKENALNKDYKEFTHPFEKELLQMSLDSAEKQALMSAVSSQTSTLISNIGGLLGNTDIEMGDNVASWMTDYMYSGWQSMADLFDMDIDVV